MTLRQAPPATSPAANSADGSPANTYRQRCARFAVERDRLERRLRLVGYGRLATFFLAAACVVWALVVGVPTIFLGAAAWFIAFLALVYYNERLSQAHRRYRELWRLDDEGLRRMARAWDDL